MRGEGEGKGGRERMCLAAMGCAMRFDPGAVSRLRRAPDAKKQAEYAMSVKTLAREVKTSPM